MRLGATEVSLSRSATRALEWLESGESPNGASIARRVRSLRNVLLSDILHGEVVRERFIPKYFRTEYGAQNLYVEDLPSFWRLLYTIVHVGEHRHIVVLEIVDHPTYDGWFPGRRRR